MMMRRLYIMVFILALTLLCSCTSVAVEPPQPIENIEWTEMPFKGFNSVWVVRETGDVFASNGKVIQVSRDQGKTWEEVTPKQTKGRHYNATGFDGNMTGEGVALFPVDSPVGWLSSDSGQNWEPFKKPAAPQVKKHDGWTFGQVDWTGTPPTRMFAKEHHTTNFWISSDAGKTWEKLPLPGGYYGMGMGSDGALLLGAQVNDDKAKKAPDGSDVPGIYRSADDGQTWELALKCNIRQKVRAQRFEDTVVWPTLEGLAVSKDGGKSWSIQENSPTDVFHGPYFGVNADDMLVVNRSGIYRTVDGGANWMLVLKKEQLPPPIRDANHQALMSGFAWDYKNNILYATSMGVAAYMGKLGE